MTFNMKILAYNRNADFSTLTDYHLDKMESVNETILLLA